jgi:hypothetical protein
MSPGPGLDGNGILPKPDDPFAPFLPIRPLVEDPKQEQAKFFHMLFSLPVVGKNTGPKSPQQRPGA